MLSDLPKNTRRFAKYAYRGINYLSRKDGKEVGFQGVYGQVRKKFQDREMRKDPPYWKDFNQAQITDLLVEALTALEQKGLISSDEDTGRYSIRKQ